VVAAQADDTVISGFVDASFFHDVNAGPATFGLDQVEVDIERAVGDNTLIRADVEFAKDGDDWAEDLEQGYVAWRPGFASRWLLTFGKFNAPMGFELLDAPDMYQFSHALVFDYGLPANLTGGMATMTASARIDLSAWWVNGWDDNDKGEGKPRTFGGRIDLSLGDAGGIGLSVISGKEWHASDLPDIHPDYFDPFEFKRTVFDLDVTLTPDEEWTLGGEINKGVIKSGGIEQDWIGFLIMAHREVNDWLGFTTRVDWFDSYPRYFFPRVLDIHSGMPRTALTFAPIFALADGVGALLEVRFDKANADIWTDGDGQPTGSNVTVAFETTCSF
jgi:hypothetical protein